MKEGIQAEKRQETNSTNSVRFILEEDQYISDHQIPNFQTFQPKPNSSDQKPDSPKKQSSRCLAAQQYLVGCLGGCEGILNAQKATHNTPITLPQVPGELSTVYIVRSTSRAKMQLSHGQGFHRPQSEPPRPKDTRRLRAAEVNVLNQRIDGERQGKKTCHIIHS